MREWTHGVLADVADIRPSNVDKLSIQGEQPVRLCNYMDVYANERITQDLPFMDATATGAEIARFRVEDGDVMLTKDSETPDDIGIPAVVADALPDLVCGYHLALLKPRTEKIDPKFLAKQLASGEAASYFARVANGSTRYGLSYNAIARTPLRWPALFQQRRIGEILFTLDEAIEQTEALIAKTQAIKAGLMHDLFTRGVTADGELRPPREEAPQLYQQSPRGWIPNDWRVEFLDDIAQRGSGHTPSKSFPEYWNGGIKWISLADSWRLDRVHIFDTEHQISQSGIEHSSAVLHPPGIVVLSRDAGVGKSAITTCEMAVSQHFMCWRCGPRIDNYFLYYWLQYRKREFENIATGSTIPTIGLRYFKHYQVCLPQAVSEQELIASTLLAADEKVFAVEADLAKMREQKAGLMHDLLTGRVPVPLPAHAPAPAVEA